MTTEAAAVPMVLTDLPSPVFRGQQMVQALEAYRELQTALDRSMPDQVMTLDGRPFRKKGYWRAIAVAFNLSVELIEERRDVSGLFADGRENFGYVVTYRATSPGGRAAVGDGSCFAVEKARRFKCPHPENGNARRTLHFPQESCPDYDPNFQWKTLPAQATEHNIRSHAQTRAFNRAVSNLVGFGEVSAEEVEREEHGSSDSPASTAVEKRADGSAMVTGIDTKTGQGAKGPWTMFVIRFDDDREGSTFDTKLKELAEGAKAAGTLVLPTLEKKGKYTNLTGLALMGLGGGETAGNGHGDPAAAITENQVKKFEAVAKGHGWTDAERAELLSVHGFSTVAEITAAAYDGILDKLKERQK